MPRSIQSLSYAKHIIPLRFGLTLAWGVIGVALRDIQQDYGAVELATNNTIRYTGVVAWIVGISLLAFSLYDAYLLYAPEPPQKPVAPLEKNQPPLPQPNIASAMVRPLGLT